MVVSLFRKNDFETVEVEFFGCVGGGDCGDSVTTLITPSID